MYSNFITPPDFVNENKHTVTIIEATEDEILSLGRYAQLTNEDYNIYLYRYSMNDPNWLNEAIQRSDSILVNVERNQNFADVSNPKFIFYKNDQTVMDYFINRQNII